MSATNYPGFNNDQVFFGDNQTLKEIKSIVGWKLTCHQFLERTDGEIAVLDKESTIKITREGYKTSLTHEILSDNSTTEKGCKLKLFPLPQFSSTKSELMRLVIVSRIFWINGRCFTIYFGNNRSLSPDADMYLATIWENPDQAEIDALLESKDLKLVEKILDLNVGDTIPDLVIEQIEIHPICPVHHYTVFKNDSGWLSATTYCNEDSQMTTVVTL